MSSMEVRHRVIEAAREQLLRGNVRRVPTASTSDAYGRPWLAQLPSGFDASRYSGSADMVLQGQFSCFSLVHCHIGFPPVWNRDPKSGVVAPLGIGRMLDYRDPSLVGDIKFLWEPNRHLELVTLAQAWHLTGNDKYLQAIRALLMSWFDQCPYPRGPNWCSSLELAIRLVNWSFAWNLMGGEGGSLFGGQEGQALRRRWLDSIYQHCHFISQFPSLFSSANNHHLGELFGLFVASVTWPMWSESDRWKLQSHARLIVEALKQNASDGVNREQATWYHHEVVDMLLIAGLVGRANFIEFPQEYWVRIEAMLEFIASVMDFGGTVPAFGDSDDAVMVRLSQDRTESVFRSLMATGAVLFRRGDFKEKAWNFDDKSRWLLGDAAAEQFEELPPSKCPALPRRSFPEGGYYILGSDFESPEEVRIVVDAGPLGYLSIAAHGHADALSFTLSAAGREILVDPGTFVYHTLEQWREYFRGTAAHNTLRVDDADQSQSGGSFMWVRHARVTCDHVNISGDPQVLVAWHDGYLRLADPVCHRRRFVYHEATRVLQVEDEIVAERSHEIEMAWHFSENCHVALVDGSAQIRTDGVVLWLTWPSDTQARIASGETQPPRGWISRRFDSIVASQTLVVRGSTKGNWRGVTEMRLEFSE